MIHHLNCATLRPVGTLGGRLTPAAMVAHCLLVERADGLLLVDTGFGSGDCADPHRLGRPFVAAMRPALNRAETAVEQVRRLGFSPEDVTEIAVTHLDLDHAGGLSDFPHARVHVFVDELQAATHPRRRERPRYVAAQWAHRPHWQTHATAGEEWFGFRAVRALDDDLLLIPLHGHTRGHCGVAVRTGDDAWLLHAGDAYFNAGEKQGPPTAPVGLRLFQTVMATDNRLRRENQERLRELHATHGSAVRVFSAHDPQEFAALSEA